VSDCESTTKKWDGTHTAYAHCPAMGQRFRLSADFDETAPICLSKKGDTCTTKTTSECDCSIDNGYYSAGNQKILRAIKKYGLILADGGSSWFITGAFDPRWDNDDLHVLTSVWAGWMEAVDESSLEVSRNSFASKVEPAPPTSTAPTSKAPTLESKSPTSKAPTSKAPTSKAPTSKAPTPESKSPTTASPHAPTKPTRKHAPTKKKKRKSG